MEKLNYTIEDSTIAELLGVQNFSTDESAVLELVKNAYDANSTKLKIDFSKARLVLTDDGIGMNYSDVKKFWMHVGKSAKEYEIEDENNKKRILAGSKGIGRFAISRLGKKATIITHKNDSHALKWITDWEETYVDEVDTDFSHGTIIIIEDLRINWTPKRIENLCAFLSKTYNDDSMQIKVVSEDFEKDVVKFFPNPQVGKNCLSDIKMKYNAETTHLSIVVDSDEFLDDIKQYCPGINIKHYYESVNIVDELLTAKDVDLDTDIMEKEKLLPLLKQVGSFNSEMLFNFNSTSADKEKFLYKHGDLANNFKGGIILYRNAFSISSYEGKKDWLGLGKRARKSPAAATHETGAWRVRDNQLLGKVEIDKRENAFLRDLSNRQGLEENVYFELFISIIHIGLKQFERYRQSIIRAVNKKNKPENNEKPSFIDELLNDKEKLSKLDKNTKDKLVKELKEIKKERSQYKSEQKDQEDKYKYDVRILNVLSTTGLKAASIAHEMNNDRNAISDFTNNVINALKEYDFWDTLNEPQYTKFAYKNIPSLIKNNQKTNNKILAFMDTMLSETEKQQFKKRWQSIADIIKEVVSNWKRDYNWIKINLIMDDDIAFNISQDMIKVIFDNLILNSIQQNLSRNEVIISIKVCQSDNLLIFEYSDNGRGLIDKYKKNPSLILEVHESSRKNGHGLGMWIVNNTAIMSGGEIIDINGDNGFYIKFSLGDEF